MTVRKTPLVVIIFYLLARAEMAGASAAGWGKIICENQGYACFRIKKGESWKSLWPNSEIRYQIMRLNRRNTPLRSGTLLAVPPSWLTCREENICRAFDYFAFSPFPAISNSRACPAPPPKADGCGELKNGRLENIKEQTIIFDPKLLAWAAYNSCGKLVRWGAASGGAKWCRDIGRACQTPVGNFAVIKKYGPRKRSNKYPLSCKKEECTPMPWFMKFHWNGLGLHGSPFVVGYNASHGCVRIFIEDAKWLNTSFAKIGTRVIVKSY